MSDRLDHLVARLSVAPTDRALDSFEMEITRAIARRREDARATTALAPVRVASIGLALAMGVAAGGAATATAISEARQSNSFSVNADLAPSTLLEGGR
jgi:hypothetical protein